jgi:glycosyltransferase involved in cell wall biosynthesis
MRIAIFSEVYWPMVSGVALTLRRLVDAMQARGHNVRVYAPQYPLPPGAVERPEVHRSPGKPFFLAPDITWAFPRVPDLVADLQEFRPQVVHLATEFAMGYPGLKAARSLGLPIIASSHTDYERYAARYGKWLVTAIKPGWRYLRWFYGHAHKVLCPTRIYEAHLHARGVMHTGIWTRGVNAEEFHPRFRSEAWRSRFGVGPADQLVTYVGRIAPEKNLPLLLDSWQALGSRRGNAQLVLIGGGLLFDSIQGRRIPGVHLVEYLHGIELATAYASADVFAFPSTTETFGNVLLEAMASGAAPVVAAAGGVLDYAIDGKNALLADPESTASYTAQLGRILGDQALRALVAEGARQTALSRRWDAIYDQLLDDYRGAIEDREAARAAA